MQMLISCFRLDLFKVSPALCNNGFKLKFVIIFHMSNMYVFQLENYKKSPVFHTCVPIWRSPFIYTYNPNAIHSKFELEIYYEYFMDKIKNIRMHVSLLYDKSSTLTQKLILLSLNQHRFIYKTFLSIAMESSIKFYTIFSK